MKAKFFITTLIVSFLMLSGAMSVKAQNDNNTLQTKIATDLSKKLNSYIKDNIKDNKKDNKTKLINRANNNTIYFYFSVKGIVKNDTTAENSSFANSIINNEKFAIKVKNGLKFKKNTYMGSSLNNEHYKVTIYVDFNNNTVSYKIVSKDLAEQDLGSLNITKKRKKQLGNCKTQFLKNAIDEYEEIKAKSQTIALDSAKKKFSKTFMEDLIKDDLLSEANDSTYLLNIGILKQNAKAKIDKEVKNITEDKPAKKLSKINAINKMLADYKAKIEQYTNNSFDSVKTDLSNWEGKYKKKDTIKNTEELSEYIAKYFTKYLIVKNIDSTDFSNTVFIQKANFQSLKQDYLVQNDFTELGYNFPTNTSTAAIKITQNIVFSNSDSTFTFTTKMTYNDIEYTDETEIKYSESDKAIKRLLTQYNTVMQNDSARQKNLEDKLVNFKYEFNAKTIVEFNNLDSICKKEGGNFLKKMLDNKKNGLIESSKKESKNTVAKQILGKFFEIFPSDFVATIKLDSLKCKSKMNKKVGNPLSKELTDLGFAEYNNAKYNVYGTYTYENKSADVTYKLKVKKITYTFKDIKNTSDDNTWNPKLKIEDKQYIEIKVPDNMELSSEIGFTDEKKEKTITNKTFEIKSYEVTNNEFVEFLNDVDIANASEYINLDVYEEITFNKDKNTYETQKGDLPVSYVSYKGAVEYCNWKTKNDSVYNYMLPTEAQWEYAARNKSNSYTTNNFSDFVIDAKNKANYIENSGNSKNKKEKRTLLIDDTYPIYDISGNLWEWTCTKERVSYITKGGAYDSDIMQILPISRQLQKSEGSYNTGFRPIRTNKN